MEPKQDQSMPLAPEPRIISPSDKKLLDEYSRAVARCGTGRVIKDVASGFWVPELVCGPFGKQ